MLLPAELLAQLGGILAGLASILAGVWAIVLQNKQKANADALEVLIEEEILSGFEKKSTGRQNGQTENAPPAVGVESLHKNYRKLIAQYHSQGLGQASISFTMSILFSIIGFFTIVFGIYAAFQNEASILGSGSSIFGGAITEAVAALFFVQANKSRQLMSDFFDKLRADNRLEEGLRLANSIEDPAISSSLRAYLAMHFSGIQVEVNGFRSVVGLPVGLYRNPPPARKAAGKTRQASKQGESRSDSIDAEENP